MDRLMRWIQLILSKWFFPNIIKGKYFTIDEDSSENLFEGGTYTIRKGPYRDTTFALKNIRIGDEQGTIIFDTDVLIYGWEGHNFTNDKYFGIIIDRIFSVLLRGN